MSEEIQSDIRVSSYVPSARLLVNFHLLAIFMMMIKPRSCLLNQQSWNLLKSSRMRALLWWWRRKKIENVPWRIYCGILMKNRLFAENFYKFLNEGLIKN